MNDGSCSTFEGEIMRILDLIENEIPKGGIDYDGDGTPETPDINAPPVEPVGPFGCDGSSYVECFYSEQLINIPKGVMYINAAQMAKLLYAVYLDLKGRKINPKDQTKYDTPFWDGYGLFPGQSCIGGQCYQRQEVNYLGQGMYTARAGLPEPLGHLLVFGWKEYKYQEAPSEGTYLWFDIGYLVYTMLNQ